MAERITIAIPTFRRPKNLLRLLEALAVVDFARRVAAAHDFEHDVPPQPLAAREKNRGKVAGGDFLALYADPAAAFSGGHHRPDTHAGRHGNHADNAKTLTWRLCHFTDGA